jgi:hypothetical protein
MACLRNKKTTKPVDLALLYDMSLQLYIIVLYDCKKLFHMTVQKCADPHGCTDLHGSTLYTLCCIDDPPS